MVLGKAPQMASYSAKRGAAQKEGTDIFRKTLLTAGATLGIVAASLTFAAPVEAGTCAPVAGKARAAILPRRPRGRRSSLCGGQPASAARSSKPRPIAKSPQAVTCAR